ncbi:uncharacterized protein EHS24_002357 [Apiotrichum porosum]|uniref:Nicotinamide n-methyltransferase n=1 Tax=Apiotrichum porosum TaxID=105984 RepID=A0A427XIG6_9TREE|nr:uncharacterized protein EHS24_002357 [Apiotrichum porosum]RSH78628.1 hypothetical protein EHS24_002357 [Apiotrichum porosum]
MAEDSADIFDDALFSLFNVPPIAFSTGSSNETTYTPPPTASDTRPVSLRLPQPPADVYSQLQANNLWLSGVFLADKIATRGIALTYPVAELGAGAGLPGILAARDGDVLVVATDYNDPDVLSALRRNYEAAFGESTNTTTSTHTHGPWVVLGHTWGESPAPLLAHSPDGFDLILADTLWASQTHEVLADSVVALLRRGGTTHVAAGLHTGRGPVARFMALAEDRGLRVTFVEQARWQPGGGWESYDGGGEEGEEERGVVVYYILRWAE